MGHAAELAAQLSAAGEFEAAERALVAAVSAEPADVALRLKLATCFARQLTFDRAIAQCLHVLHTPSVGRTDLIAGLDLLSRCATQVGAPEMILPYLTQAGLEHSADLGERCWSARLLRQGGFAERALRVYEDVLERLPGDPFVTLYVGETKLQMGDESGREQSMAFTSRAFFRTYFPDIPSVDRMWEGEPLEGKSITIIPQAGHGDCFQFAGHIPQLRRLGARHVTFVARAPYGRLLASAGIDEVLGYAECETARARSDFWVSDFGLLRAEGEAGGPRKVSGYLTPPPSEAASVVSGLARRRAGGRPCLGLYWHSDAEDGEVKSVPLAALASLFARADIHWVILQRGFGLRRMIEAGLGGDATVPDEELPFDDAGALLAQLDGMVTNCAWPFHLAGAVGTRTWLLAGRVMSSRHLNRERNSILYPDRATIARQPKAGDWFGAVTRLHAELDLALRQDDGPSGSTRPTIAAP